MAQRSGDRETNGELPLCQELAYVLPRKIYRVYCFDAARHIVKKAYLYANNHFSAQSVANATTIKQQLGEPIEGDYPPEFVERFPQLKDVVHVDSSQKRALFSEG